jgi:hypothetical protein
MARLGEVQLVVCPKVTASHVHGRRCTATELNTVDIPKPTLAVAGGAVRLVE